jgi:hypothetical protein
MYCCSISENSLISISKLHQLTKLRLYGSAHKFTDSGIKLLSALKHLQFLDLTSFMGITDEGIAWLAELPELSYLSLERANIGDKGLFYIGEIKKLKSLFLPRCGNITSDGLRYIANLSHLEVLNLSNCNGISGEGFGYISELMNLKNLILADSFLPPENFAQLSGLVNLTSLNLSSCGITHSGLEYLYKLENLKHLILSFSPQITDQSLFFIRTYFYKLEELLLNKCDNVTDYGLCSLVTLPLKELNISFCKISEEALNINNIQKIY